MSARVILAVVGVLLALAIAGFMVVRVFTGRAPEQPEETPTPDGSREEPLFGQGGAEGSGPLFAPDAPTGAGTGPSGTFTEVITEGGTDTGTGAFEGERVHPDTWEGQPDTDGDGLPDAIETRYSTDKANPDTDGDGFPDGAEVKKGYSPVRPGDSRLDSDNDGLREDEEFRWRTDPFNPDTDGDGFQDGAEVQNGFDPTVAGDGQGSDALPERRAAQATQAFDVIRPDPRSQNYTEALTGIILGNRPSSDAGELTVTPQEVKEVLDTAQLDTTLPETQVTELNVTTQQNTVNDVRAYLDAIDAVRPPQLLDAAFVSTALTRATQGDVGDLNQVRASVDAFEAELLKIRVPPSATKYHALYVSLIRQLSQSFRDIAAAGASDPARVYVVSRELQASVSTHLPEFTQLRRELGDLARGQ